MPDEASAASELQTLSVTIQTSVNDGTLDVGAPLLDFDMSLSLDPSVSGSTVQTASPASSSEESLLWPVTIMVASLSFLVGCVLLLVLILKKLKSKTASAKVDSEKVFVKVLGPNSTDMAAPQYSFDSNVSSTREITQAGGRASAFKFDGGKLKKSNAPVVQTHHRHASSTADQLQEV